MSTPWSRPRFFIVASTILAFAGACAAGGDSGGDLSLSCGDGLLDQSNGEACDDGNRVSGDGCSEDCQLEGANAGAGGGASNGAGTSTGGAVQGAGGGAGTGSAAQGSGGSSGSETICDDQIDNDNDNATDCADRDCAGQPCGNNGLVCDGASCECPGGNTESQCGDMADDDCDGLTDCADSDCDGDSACVGTICPGPSTLDCGSSVTGTTVGGPTNIYGVSCNGVAIDGPEAYYTLTLSSDTVVTVTLDGDNGTFPDLDLAILHADGSDCDPQDCITFGWGATNDEEEEFGASANVTYYIVVESALSAGNSFSLDVSCN